MELVIGTVVFLTIVLLVEGVYYAFRGLSNPDVQSVRRRLRTLSSGGFTREEINILRLRILSEVPWFNRLLLRTGHLRGIDRLLEQANTGYPLGFFILLSAVLALLGFLAGSFLVGRHPVKIPLALILGAIPFYYIFAKKRKRMEKFQRQLPDALNLISRALKAGHAFTSGFKIAAEEFDDPIGTEFDKTISELNFGIGLPQAMKNLTARVDCQDLSFFAIAVIIQRETGGNLAEIIENISYLIRERFKLWGRIRVLSAEARFSAVVLIILPFVIVLYFLILRPFYIKILIGDPLGRLMILVAMMMMALGIYVMRRMVRFKI